MGNVIEFIKIGWMSLVFLLMSCDNRDSKVEVDAGEALVGQWKTTATVRGGELLVVMTISVDKTFHALACLDGGVYVAMRGNYEVTGDIVYWKYLNIEPDPESDEFRDGYEEVDKIIRWNDDEIEIKSADGGKEVYQKTPDTFAVIKNNDCQQLTAMHRRGTI